MATKSSVYRYQLRDPATLLGGASGFSFACPCKGARYVIFHFKSTDATDTLSAFTFYAGNDIAGMFSGGGAVISTLLVALGNPLGLRMDRTDGLVFVVCPISASPHLRIPWNLVQANFTAGGATPTNDISGFAVTAEVVYDDGEDELFNQQLVIS